MFKTQFNADKFRKYENETVSQKPSATVPNMALTITEIYKRYATGRPMSGAGEPLYDDDGIGQEIDFDSYLPDLSRLDMAERQMILESAKEHLDDIKYRLDAEAKARQRQKAEKDKETEKRLKDLEQYRQAALPGFQPKPGDQDKTTEPSK